MEWEWKNYKEEERRKSILKLELRLTKITNERAVLSKEINLLRKEIKVLAETPIDYS